MRTPVHIASVSTSVHIRENPLPNANKRRGDRAEVAVRDALRRLGFPAAERTRAGYARDHGDVHADPDRRGIVLQCKDVARAAYPAWLAEVEEQRAAAGYDFGVVIHKRRGVGDAGKWIAIMTLAEWARLARQAGYGGGVLDPNADELDEAEETAS